MFIVHVRARTVLVVLGMVVAGLLLLHPDAHAAGPDPAPTTTVAEAQADPIWAENGLTAVGQDVPAQWLDRGYWDTVHTFTTPGEVHPNVTGRALTFGGYRHEFNGALISTITMDPSTHKVTGWVAANPAPPQCPTAAPCTGLGTAHGITDVNVNPIAWLAGQFGEAAGGILGWTMTDAARSLKPDLTLPWWVDAYQKSYGVGVISLIFLLAVLIGRGVKRGETAEQYLADLGTWLAGFFVTATMGPIVGQLLVNGASTVADNIAKNSDGSGAISGLQTIINAVTRTTNSNGQNVGAALISLVLLAICCVAAAAAYAAMVLGTAVAYLSSALFLIGYAWVLLQKYRHTAHRAIRVFASVVAAKPLMFFMLGIGVNVTAAAVTGSGSAPQDVGTLLTGSLVLLSSAAAAAFVWHYVGVKDGGAGQVAGSQLGGMMMMTSTQRATSVLRGRR